MHFLRLQASIVWFWSLFGEGLMCMCHNLKLLCCAAYILSLIVSICLFCWPNLWCSGVFSAEFRGFRKNSANPDISRKYGSASRIILKNPAEGSRVGRQKNREGDTEEEVRKGEQTQREKWGTGRKDRKITDRKGVHPGFYKCLH